jgi:hypothetical protein
MTLYKHGVGFFERRAEVSGESLELSFRVEEMNDILKSLTALDFAGGQVLGVEYATPQTTEEQLAGCSIRLADDRSLRDLLVGLRGRLLCLGLDQGEQVSGTLVGLDELPERQPVASSLVSVLALESDQVQTVSLGRVQTVEIQDERSGADLRFFLKTALAQDDYRQVTIRLTPGEHDLSLSYVAPAPTWRVSYRLVTESRDSGQDAGAEESAALVQGWGIFDNQLDEDLSEISLSLVAGMPISFVYNLYESVIPQRPEIEDEARIAPGPVELAAAAEVPRKAARFRGVQMEAADAFMEAPSPISADLLEQAMPAVAEGEALGELFQYVIATPVTVSRGHSAMVPIVSSRLTCRKDLVYNGTKLPGNPVATLRLDNETGLTLERGPVTVIDGGEYVGEAVLPFTVAGGEVVVPYAVELGVRVQEEAGSKRQLRGVRIKGAYLLIEEWDIRWREFQLNNTTGREMVVLTEHPRSAHYEPFDTSEPEERTDEHLRYRVEVPARGEARLRVQERRLLSRREELRRQSYKRLQRLLADQFLEREAYEQVAELLGLWEQIEDNQTQLKETEQERQKAYEAQKQIQGNMGALSTTGKEGALRARYVDELERSEDRLKALDETEADLVAQIEQLRQTIESRLKALE